MLTINEEITLENQQERISALLPQGCRFVTMTAVDSSTHFDIYYHFDRNGELYTLRLKLGREEALPSISGLCFAAPSVRRCGPRGSKTTAGWTCF